MGHPTIEILCIRYKEWGNSRYTNVDQTPRCIVKWKKHSIKTVSCTRRGYIPTHSLSVYLQSSPHGAALPSAGQSEWTSIAAKSWCSIAWGKTGNRLRNRYKTSSQGLGWHHEGRQRLEKQSMEQKVRAVLEHLSEVMFEQRPARKKSMRCETVAGIQAGTASVRWAITCQKRLGRSERLQGDRVRGESWEWGQVSQQGPDHVGPYGCVRM